MKEAKTERESTTTLEIAKQTGKEHKNVIRDTRKMLEELGMGIVTYQKSYKDNYGRDQKCYSLPDVIADKLLVKYDTRPKQHGSDKIYIFKCKDTYKIGISLNIESRLKTCQTGNPYKINILFQKNVKNPRKLESILHLKFKADRLNGEWFKLSDSQIEIAINEIKKGR